MSSESREETGRDERTGQFMPGHSGNPSGQAKGTPHRPSLLAAIKKKLGECPELLDEIAANLLELAKDGDHKAVRALRTVFDRLDGPVATKIELDGDGEVEFRVRFPKPAGTGQPAEPQGEDDATERPEGMDDAA